MDHVNPEEAQISPPMLQVYGQNQQHQEIYMVGNKAGLLQLKQAIERALEEDVAFALEYVADGEGYDVIVLCNDNHWQGEPWQDLQLPYTAEYYHYNVTKHPHDLLTEEQKEAYIKHARGEENEEGN